MNKKNKSNSNDQSELTVDSRTGNRIGHVLNWYQKNLLPDCMICSRNRLHFLVLASCAISWMSVVSITSTGEHMD